MAITDIFSKRQARKHGQAPDVYVYNILPPALRVQIVHIWTRALGSDFDSIMCDGPKFAYSHIVTALCEEYGVYRLATPPNEFPGKRLFFAEIVAFIEGEKTVERVLDAVEVSFRVIDSTTRDPRYLHRQNSSEIADEAINTLNARFQEHGVGYRYADGKIIRIDSEFLHSEAVLPSLTLLQDARYKGAHEEFLCAHTHYRNGQLKEAVNECLKALESVMKVICGTQGWSVPQTATANNLIKALFDNGLIPPYLQAHYNSLRSLLESGVPTVRNNNSGHGQGGSSRTVPGHLVAYTLHMTASAIVFLVESEKAHGK